MVKYFVLMALVAATVVSLIILAVRSKRNGGAVAFTFSRVQFIVAAGVWGLLAAGLIAGAVVVFVRSDSPQSWLSLFFCLCMFMNVFALTLLTARAKANGTYNSTLQWLDLYNSLPEEEQLAISAIPADLLEASGISDAEDTEATSE